jgi:uncharacterized protein YegP (UPF0339 family)
MALRYLQDAAISMEGGNTMAAKFEVYEDMSGEFRWRLVHANGQVIATSGEGYRAKAKAISGIDSVKENAQSAAVEDKTV